MTRSVRACEVYPQEKRMLGEGPTWSASAQALYWLDIAQCKLFRRAPRDTQSREWAFPDYPGCVAELDAQSIAVAMGGGVQQRDLGSGTTQLLCAPKAPRPGTRFNDGKVDPKGRSWVGTVQNNFGPEGESIPIELRDGALTALIPAAASKQSRTTSACPVRSCGRQAPGILRPGQPFELPLCL